MDTAAETGPEQVTRAADGTFPNGVSGNPRGRPRGKELRTLILEACDDAVDLEALKRNVAMVQEIADKGADPKDRMAAAKLIREWNVPREAVKVEMTEANPVHQRIALILSSEEMAQRALELSEGDTA